MTDWMWVLALFIGMTAMYWVGFAAGSWKTDRAPSAAVWRLVREHSIDAQTETAIANINAEHEEQMALIARGAFDNLDFDEEEQEDGGNA